VPYDVFSATSSMPYGIYSEDTDGQPGYNAFYGGLGDYDPQPTTEISTSTVRSGGGNSSIVVRPGTRLAPPSVNLSLQIKMFEYPIYTDTTNRTYTMYFMASTSAYFTANPTASELWIECEYYGNASNAHRKITKSTGTVDFTGSTAWQALTVTCQPVRSGILYLRGWYAKPREDANPMKLFNSFFVDVEPVFSTP
jgi:hypothetical protein